MSDTTASQAAAFYPPTLELPDQSALRWTSLTKVIRRPEENWPAQICEQPIHVDRVGDRTLALIADPEAARIVLTGSEALFPKWRIYERVLSAGIGRESLSSVAGEQWRKQHAVFNPMFRSRAAARHVPLFQRATVQAISGWDSGGVRIDTGLEMTRLTLGAIWRALFDPAAAEAPAVTSGAAERIHNAQLSRDANGSAAVIGELAETAERERSAHGFPGAFSGLGTGRSEGRLTPQELRDNARVMIGAGHETTALTLTWALWLVAQQPDIQARLHAELDRVLDGSPVQDAHLSQMDLVQQVLNETLRLYPPALATVRQTREQVVLAGEVLPAGTVLVVCFYALHRHRKWWDQPDAFLPERFEVGKGPRHRFAFLPFSAGQHTCIGAAFAWKEAMTMFATLLQHLRVEADPTGSFHPRMDITLRPDGVVPLIAHRRM